jgi:A/G-specific adenine glycosylase
LVLPYWQRWMARFPSLEALAAAEEHDVLLHWQGLGYYRRARNLHAAAKKISVNLRGEVPRDYEGLRNLPGIGDYTAQAVRAFAFDEAVPVLDANVVRVVARLFDIRMPVDTAKGLGKVRAKLEDLLPAKGGHEFASAMMELGARVCIARFPLCAQCPLALTCAWRASGYPDTGARGVAKQARYTGSDRQARGALLKVLRTASQSVTRATLEEAWPDNAQRVRALLSLIDDGLVIPLARNRFGLPE